MESPDPNRILAEQLRRNRITRDNWQAAAPHRKRVTELLVGAGARGATLGVLGAGNCNDLDLPALCGVFQQIHLVDLDAEALAAALQNQQLSAPTPVQLHGGVDVTGIAGLLSSWTADKPPSSTVVDALLQQTEAARPRLLSGACNVVASVCVLSQLFDSVALALGERHPRYLDLIVAVRKAHLLLLVEMLALSGTGLLLTDIVSSETDPDLSRTAEEALPTHLSRLIADRNFFTGTNPFILKGIFESDPDLSQVLDQVQLLPPWLWQLGTRTYAVCALAVRKRA